MIIKTEDLSGKSLDYAVAISEGFTVGELDGYPNSLCAGRNGTCVGMITGGWGYGAFK